MSRAGALLPAVLAMQWLAGPATAGWGDPVKADQLAPVDSRSARSWRDHSGNYFYLCADDFVCTETGRISEVRVRGIDDPYVLGVEILFWADIPASPGGDSHPGELLYSSGRLPFADADDPNRVGWYDAGGGEFRATLPQFDRFLQQGAPQAPVVYWVGVQVYHDLFGFEEFFWNHRQPGYQSGGAAVYSDDGYTWQHWGQNPQGAIATYAGSLPAGWQPVDMTFQLCGAPQSAQDPIGNSSFEIEWADEMPMGGGTYGPPYDGMPEHWPWRRVGNVNGHGEALLNNPEWNWASDGEYALYLFAWRYGDHNPGDRLEFYQAVDFTGVRSLWFDVCIRQNVHDCRAYVAVDGQEVWNAGTVGVKLNQGVDVSAWTGVHELAVGLRVMQPFGEEADGHVFFDHFRAVGPGDMDGDLDVDYADFDRLADCLAGPQNAVPSGCAPADLDADGDADMRDFSAFQASFTGELAPPT